MNAQFPLDLGIPTRHIVMLSGGIGGHGCAERVIAQHGVKHVSFLFTDTLMEDSDLYRFLIESACKLVDVAVPADWLADVAQLPEWHEDRFGRRLALDDLRTRAARFVPQLIWIADGRDPREVFIDGKFIGNSRVDPCAAELKRDLADRWLRTNCHRDNTIVYLGFDWSEKHRFDDGEGHGALHRYGKNGWTARSPLCDAPFVREPWNKIARCADAGLRPARLYILGEPHNNCGGGCVKKGIGGWAHRYRTFPERFAVDEQMEADARQQLGKDVSILTDRRGGERRPLTLRDLRARVDAGETFPMDTGGCGCFGGPVDVVEGEFEVVAA